jgi:hypothetical protein
MVDGLQALHEARTAEHACRMEQIAAEQLAWRRLGEVLDRYLADRAAMQAWENEGGACR